MGNEPKEISLRIIVVDSASEAERILQRVNQGDDFAVLAKEKSTDSTADAGGFMGKVDPASLRSELRNALVGLAPGQITPVLRIPSGYAILKVVSDASISETETASRARRTAVAATWIAASKAKPSANTTRKSTSPSAITWSTASWI